jgi:hypothetical protein
MIKPPDLKTDLAGPVPYGSGFGGSIRFRTIRWWCHEEFKVAEVRVNSTKSRRHAGLESRVHVV